MKSLRTKVLLVVVAILAIVLIALTAQENHTGQKTNYGARVANLPYLAVLTLQPADFRSGINQRQWTYNDEHGSEWTIYTTGKVGIWLDWSNQDRHVDIVLYSLVKPVLNQRLEISFSNGGKSVVTVFDGQTKTTTP